VAGWVFYGCLVGGLGGEVEDILLRE